MTPFVLGIIIGLVCGYFGRQAWKEASDADRLEALHGRPSPFFWEDR